MASPILARPVQDGAQLLEEEAHGLGVVVALAQRVVDVAQGVESDSQRDSGRQLPLGLRVLLANIAPGSSTIISPVQPALVHVQDDLVLNVLPQKCLRPSLPLVDVQGGVDVERLLSYLAVLHSEILLEHRDDEALCKR